MGGQNIEIREERIQCVLIKHSMTSYFLRLFFFQKFSIKSRFDWLGEIWPLDLRHNTQTIKGELLLE